MRISPARSRSMITPPICSVTSKKPHSPDAWLRQRPLSSLPAVMTSDTAVNADPRSRLQAEIGLLAMVFIWGLNFAVVKNALLAFAPLGFNSLRHLLASAFMLVVLLA